MTKKGYKILKIKLNFPVRFGISAVIILFLLTQLEFNQAMEVLRVGNRNIMFLALLIFIFSTIINSFRWYLLTAEHNLAITFPKILILNFTGFFFSMFFAGRTGGDFARAYLITKSSQNRALAVSTIIIWRLLGVISLTIISLISSIFLFSLVDDKSLIMYIIFIISSIYFLLFSLSRKSLITKLDPIFSLLYKFLPSLDIRSKITALYSALREYIPMRNLLGINLLLGLITHVLEILSWYLISLSIGIDSSFILFLMIVPIINLLQIIPLTFSGVGLREGAAVVLFGYIGFTDYISLSIGLTFSLFNIILGLIGGIVYLFKK